MPLRPVRGRAACGSARPATSAGGDLDRGLSRGKHDRQRRCRRARSRDDRPVGVGWRPSPAVEQHLGDEHRPPAHPTAVANEPARLYQAKTRASAARTRWLSAACSTARNGPTSLPLGLMTPIVAATSSTGEVGRVANTSAGDDHQQRAGDEDPPPAEPVGVRGQPQRDRPCRRRGSASGAARSRVRSSPSAARYSTSTTARKP